MSTWIARLRTLYGEPDTDNLEAYLNEFREVFEGYADAVMDKAVSRLRIERKFKTWPTIGEFKKCADACLGDVQRPTRVPWGHDPTWSKECVKQAYALIKSPMGVRAGEEGWILAMWHFCRENQRVPRGSEITDCKQSSRTFNDAYAACLRGGFDFAVPLARLGESMIARREKLATLAAESQGLTETSRRMTGEAG